MPVPVRLAPAGSSHEQRIAALESELKRIGALAGSSLLIGSNQRSSVPGDIIAGRIRTEFPPSVPQMSLDLIQQGAGLGPILWVTDGIQRRVEAGFLGANGNSPQQYGFRANDSGGNPIFDSLGLIQSMVLVGQINGINATTSATSFTTIASTTITATRTQNFLGLITVIAQYINSNAPSVSRVRLLIGSQSSNSLELDGPGGGGATLNTTMSGFAAALSLTAGSYTVAVQAMANTGTILVIDGTVNVFLVGG